MERDSSGPVEDVSLAGLLVVGAAQTAVHHEAERDEVSIRAQSQEDVDAGHVVEQELVHHQKDDLEALEQQQPLHLGPGIEHFGVVDEATNHKLRHNGGLQTDPHLLDDGSNRLLVVLVVLFGEDCTDSGVLSCPCSYV